MDMFVFEPPFNGLLVDDGDGCRIYAFTGNSEISILNGGGFFGYVASGRFLLEIGGTVHRIPKGHYFTTPEGLFGEMVGEASVFAVQKSGHKGVFSMGLVEDEGRLNYIDGAKDSILAYPIKKGDPCLNALFMPNGVDQTMHTHPSTRAGFIVSGAGSVCETPTETIPLKPGTVFYLKKDGEHKFRTDGAADASLKLVAFHPDSDFGPTDEVHPMLNRTIVDGVSASEMPEIQTK